MLRLSLFLAGSMCMDDADVQTLIDRLGDERYVVRARAQTHLEQVLLSGSGHIHRHIVEAALDNPDLEIARRARAALDLYYNIAPSTYPVLPWIDMLPPNYPGRQILIESCLFQVRTPGAWGYGPDWPEYRHATGVVSRRLLSEGYPRPCVRQLLDDMVEEEKRYREKHGMRDIAAR